MPSIISEHEQHIDSGGLPIVNGYIYIGERNKDPTLLANQITIYSDRALGVVLSNPQRTDADGRSVNKIWIPGRYSIAIHDSEDTQKYIELDAGENPETGISALTNVQGTNTITADGDPTIDTLLDQQAYIFRAAGGNTGAVTLQIDLTAAKSVLKQHDVPLISGDMEANQTIYVVYNELDDTFELINQPIILSAVDFTVSNDLTVGNDATISNSVITDLVTAETTNGNLTLSGNGSGIVDTDSLTATTLNGDLELSGNGTGIVNIDTVSAVTLNGDLELQRNGTGDITIDTVPVYGMLILDTPEELINTTTPATTATAVNSTTLNTAGATKAILRIYAATAASSSLQAQFASSTFTASNVYIKSFLSSGSIAEANEFTVNLDSNNDFWYLNNITGTLASYQVVLVGYYV